jgi:hypothetical protein
MASGGADRSAKMRTSPAVGAHPVPVARTVCPDGALAGASESVGGEMAKKKLAERSASTSPHRWQATNW